ncbi:MAG: hypothetical protein MJZ57_06615 [Bacteroidales bacterium]|nr:hypothetical protein [Bacteroidales bacterium]
MKMKPNDCLKTVTDVLKEIRDYADSIGYDAVVLDINLERENVTFLLRREEIVDRREYGYTKRWYERRCSYRYSVQTYDIGSEESGDCHFDRDGYQVGGEYRF